LQKVNAQNTIIKAVTGRLIINTNENIN